MSTSWGRLRLRPTGGGVRVGGHGGQRQPAAAHRIAAQRGRNDVDHHPYFFLDRYIPSYVHEWAAFVAYVSGGGESPVPAADGRAPLVIGLAAKKSVAENRIVQITEIG